jgi:urease accessory protein
MEMLPPQIIIIMTDRSIIQLMTLLSPVFPVGGFAYSGGLETVSQNGRVTSRDDVRQWIETALLQGTLRNDAVLLAAAHRQYETLAEVNNLALSLAGSAERYREVIALGAAFKKAATPWINRPEILLPEPIAYCVAVGAITAGNGLALRDVLHAFFQATVSNQLQAALRLMSLGQQGAVALLHGLEPLIMDCTNTTLDSTLDDLGSSAIAMEVACMQHETISSRIFRS